MRLIALAAALGAAALLPTAAHAGTLTGDSGRIDFRAAAGETYSVRMFLEHGQFTVTDAAPLGARGQCVRVNTFRARCGTVNGGILRLGDRNDTTLVQVATSGRLTILGGDGDDTFMDGAAHDGPSRVTYAGTRHRHGRLRPPTAACGSPPIPSPTTAAPATRSTSSTSRTCAAATSAT